MLEIYVQGEKEMLPLLSNVSSYAAEKCSITGKSTSPGCMNGIL